MTNTAVMDTINDTVRRKLTPQERKLVNSVFWRSMWLMFCTSYTKQQGTTFGWTMIPYLEEIYGKGTDEFYKAMGRHQDFFNTTPGMSPFIFTMVISMEKERKAALDAGKPFEDSSIESIKVALMGPFAGIGDSIYSGAFPHMKFFPQNGINTNVDFPSSILSYGLSGVGTYTAFSFRYTRPLESPGKRTVSFFLGSNTITAWLRRDISLSPSI